MTFCKIQNIDEELIKVELKLMNIGTNKNGRKYDMDILLSDIDKNINIIKKQIKNQILYGNPNYNPNKMDIYITGNKIGSVIFEEKPKSFSINSAGELCLDEYRKFIEENKYGRIGDRGRLLSVPRIQYTKNNRNTI